MARIVVSILFALGFNFGGISCQSANSPENVKEPQRTNPSAPTPPAETNEAQVDKDVKVEPKKSGPAEEQAKANGKPLECEGGRKIGETWTVDCNNCRCTENGQTACTLMHCGDAEPNPSTSTSGAGDPK